MHIHIRFVWTFLCRKVLRKKYIFFYKELYQVFVKKFCRITGKTRRWESKNYTRVAGVINSSSYLSWLCFKLMQKLWARSKAVPGISTFEKNFFSTGIKGTLMQIRKCPCMYLLILKYCPENFAFLTLRILELYTRKVSGKFVYKYTEKIEQVKK